MAEISDLGRSRALLAWDERTQMPAAGGEARAHALATLTRVRHERLSSPRLGELLESLSHHARGLPADSLEASLIRVASRDHRKASLVPAELRAETAHVSSLAETAWERARGSSDWPAFLPHLRRVIELKRSYVECFAPYEHPYDPLLDDFEPGLRTSELRPLLGALRDGLLELLREIESSGFELDDSSLYGEFDRERQWQLARRVAAAMPLSADAWRLDDTAHPFLTTIARSDVRVTTRFDPGYVGTSLWALIHEFGHGIYANGLDPALARSPLARSPSLGFDESQSRLWENWVGRGRPFLAHLLPVLREHFGEQLGELGAEGLYRAANRVARSPVRMEADEVTYNLHIILRFELELAIFERRLEPEDLPEAWRERSLELLGVDVTDHALGVLQDVHWAAGSFGYFPTYSLGNVIAAALWERVEADLPELDAQLAAGRLEPLRDLLGERLYRHGGKFEPSEMVRRLTGGPLDVGPLLRHLRRKYGELYELR